jgi:hypothetical protein
VSEYYGWKLEFIKAQPSDCTSAWIFSVYRLLGTTRKICLAGFTRSASFKGNLMAAHNPEAFQMNAIRLRTCGGPEVLVYELAPTPRPGAGKVLVRVHAAAVTPTELGWPPTWTTRDGKSRPFPVVPGHEFSGEVYARAGRPGKGMARDLGRRGITINNVQPRPVDTDMNPADGSFGETLRKLMALPRYGAADEIAAWSSTWRSGLRHRCKLDD